MSYRFGIFNSTESLNMSIPARHVMFFHLLEIEARVLCGVGWRELRMYTLYEKGKCLLC